MLLNNPDGFISQEFEAVFALVGMYDKGKTFILNKLTGLNFKSGKKHTTRGLSMKEVSIDGENLFVLDTAGTSSPIDLSKLQERDKKLTEAYIQEVAFSLSDYFIVVVNDFTAKDQKFLKKLIRYIENYKASKSIIVVHNFKDVGTQELHQHVWDSQVINIFKELEENEGKTTKVMMREVDSDRCLSENVHIYKTRFSLHVSLVNDFTEYGHHYNLFGIQLIKDLLRRQIIRSKRQIIYKKLIENIKLTLNNVNLIIEDTVKGKIIKPENKGDVEGLISRLSYKLIRPDEFEPTFDCAKIDNNYAIILDVPGMKKSDFTIIHENNRTIISGTRKKDHEQEDAGIHRKSGSFKLEFPIPAEFESRPVSKTLEDGILKILFPLYKVETGEW